MDIPDQDPAAQRPCPGNLPASGSQKPGFDWEAASAVAHRMALGFCRISERDLANDIAQEALLKFSKKDRTQLERWESWLYKVIQNTAYTFLKRESQRRARDHPDVAAAFEAAQSKERGPLDILRAEEFQRRLKSLLESLDAEFGEGTRAIVELRAQGTAWSETAVIVRIPERTCRHRRKVAVDWMSGQLELEATKGEQRD